MQEIEQKYEFHYLPSDDMVLLRHTVVYRKYLSCNPEVRINKRVFDLGHERYHLTIKNDRRFIRDEIKLTLSKEQYEDISKLIGYTDMIFDVYEYQLPKEHTISFKIGKNVNIRFAEIEYNSEIDCEEMHDYISGLDFLGQEVTYDDRYYLKNVWSRCFSG